VARVRLAIPELVVVCAGEGPVRPVLEQRIAYLGLRQIVRLAGHVPDVPALLACAHAAWTPGLRATVEAMAAGVPVASPWRELIGADLAVGRGDPAALAGRLLALLRDRKVGAVLRKRAEKDYSLDAFLARVGLLYDAVLAQARVAA
jgi:glycosyltransferase involved in cell wall biosynthesis